MQKSVSRTPSGISGLDEILGGGFPQGRVVLVLGEPGAGKTILCSQFLINGINRYGENGLLVSMEENRTHYDREMNQFGWDFTSAEDQKKFSFVDASPIRAIPGEVKIGKLTIGRQDFSLLSLLELIRNNAKSINAKRIVVDPVSLLIFQYPEESARRKALLDLVEAMTETGATCILSSELRGVGLKGRLLQTEEYLVHGVVLMQTVTLRQQKTMGETKQRTIQVEKMRETQIDSQPRPYKITPKGIEVYPREAVI
jgi:KaiC/GvpD/RAD55 family RecA-like ATPase